METGKKTRIIILSIWAVLALIAATISLIVELAGDTIGIVWWGVGLGTFFIGSTWCFCWIGFPIGWRACRGMREAFEGSDIPYCIALIVSIFVSGTTFALSTPIAICQVLFKKDWD